MVLARSAVLLSALTFIAGSPAGAADELKPVAEWTVSKNFKGAEARLNLSGGACATFKSCLIVNDEENYAQFFSIDIDKAALDPGDEIVLREKAEGDPDGEGAAFANGFFYVTGSHGRARHSIEKSSVPSYVVFRIRQDDKKVEASTRLHDVIHDTPELLRFFNVPLDDNGVNIEGIAVSGGRMYLGFRGPSTEAQAFILSVDAEKIFSKKDPVGPVVKKVTLGPTTGIRDLAAVQGGILLLSGPVNDQPPTPKIFFWKEATDELKQLGELGIPDKLKEAKAETLLVLRDEPDKKYRVLIMFDGAENGAPTEYLVPR